MSERKICGDGGVVTTSTGTGGTSDVNLIEIAGTAVDTESGAASAGTLLTATASDSPDVALLATIDADTDTIAGDTTSLDAKTPALGAGAIAASVPVNIASDQDVPVQGDTDHDDPDAGSPVKIGGHARTSQRAAVAEGNRVDSVWTRFGELVLAAYDWATGTIKVTEQNGLDQRFLNITPDVDTTNETATIHRYPSDTGQSHDGYSDLSMTLKVIDGDGTVTITLEATNDEDTASGDWHDITTALECDASDNPIYRNTTGNLSFIITNGTMTLALRIPRFNYANLRWVAEFTGATNTAVLKGRVKAL